MGGFRIGEQQDEGSHRADVKLTVNLYEVIPKLLAIFSEQ
jgi:hypothetical protein